MWMQNGTKEIEKSQKSKWSLCSGTKGSLGDHMTFWLPPLMAVCGSFFWGCTFPGPHSPSLLFSLYLFVSSSPILFPTYFPFHLLKRRSSLANHHCSYWVKLFMLLGPDCFLGHRLADLVLDAHPGSSHWSSFTQTTVQSSSACRSFCGKDFIVNKKYVDIFSDMYTVKNPKFRWL